MSPKDAVPRTQVQDEEEEIPHQPGSETYDENGVKYHKLTTDLNYKHKLIPHKVFIFVLLHMAAFYGLYLILSFKLKLLSFLWGTFLGLASAEGIVLGSHRGFSHNSFKLTKPFQAIIIICQTISGQNHVYWWARDHRLHHKFCDTDADPYNAQRGFWFSHVGWLITKKHPLVAEKGKTIDTSDMRANELIMFQKKYTINFFQATSEVRYYVPMFIVFNILIPTLVPVYFWNEDIWIAFFTCFAYRYVHVLQSTWCINSLAHMYGTRPFDARISARQSHFADFFTFGDGWHNYHHVFPWDHAMSEFGFGGGMSTTILYFLYRIGAAYDLKKPSPELVYKHWKRHGDATLSESDFETFKKNYVKSF